MPEARRQRNTSRPASASSDQKKKTSPARAKIICPGRSSNRREEILLQVTTDELRHLEHRDLFLAAEDRLQIVVGVDHRPLGFVLKPFALDVGPEFFRNLSARQRLASHPFRQSRGRLHRLHECSIRFAFRHFSPPWSLGIY